MVFNSTSLRMDSFAAAWVRALHPSHRRVVGSWRVASPSDPGRFVTPGSNRDVDVLPPGPVSMLVLLVSFVAVFRVGGAA
jgi:hypothetical protein